MHGGVHVGMLPCLHVGGNGINATSGKFYHRVLCTYSLVNGGTAVYLCQFYN